MTFFDIMGSWVDYHGYDSRTKITGELQFLLDYGKIFKLSLVTFLYRNQLNSRVFHWESKLSIQY